MRATMKFYFVLSACTAVVASAALIAHAASTSTDKYMVKVPGGLAFSEFQGYESWQTVSISYRDNVNAVILANPIMIKAFEAGIPQNGKPFPDGAKMAKIHWTPTKNEYFQDTTVSGAQQNADFMEKDSKRFADTGGWGYAAFEYEVTSNTFRPEASRISLHRGTTRNADLLATRWQNPRTTFFRGTPCGKWISL